MRERIEARLARLQQEYEAGQKLLADLEARQADLRQTLLRISGAMQVLQELLAPDGPRTDGLPDPDHSRADAPAARRDTPTTAPG